MATIQSGKSRLNTHMQSMIPSLTTMCGCESMNRKRSGKLFITLLTSYTWEDSRWFLLSSLCCSHFTIKMHHFDKNILAPNKRIVSMCYQCLNSELNLRDLGVIHSGWRAEVRARLVQECTSAPEEQSLAPPTAALGCLLRWGLWGACRESMTTGDLSWAAGLSSSKDLTSRKHSFSQHLPWVPGRDTKAVTKTYCTGLSQIEQWSLLHHFQVLQLGHLLYPWTSHLFKDRKE